MPELSKTNFVLEMQRCAVDPIYFIEKYCYIKDHQNHKAIKFHLWPEQRELVKEWCRSKYLCVLKARQIGVTWLITDCLSLWEAMFTPFQEILIICTKEDKAIDMLDSRIKFTFSLLPDWMKPPVCVDNLTELRFGKRVKDKSGMEKIVGLNSGIKAETSGKNAARSSTITNLIFEEMAHIEEGLDEMILSAFPTVETCRGRVSCISTAKGDVGAFRDIFWDGWNNRSSAIKADDEMVFKSSFLPWGANPNRNQKWYDNTRKRPEYRSDQDFMQEFPTTPEEAFKSSGSPVFDHDTLTAWQKDSEKKEFLPKAIGELSWRRSDFKKDHRSFFQKEPDTDYGVSFEGVSHGTVLVFDFPERRHTKNRYSISCDPASGELDTGTGHKKDQTSITVYDYLTMRISARVFSNKIEPSQAAEILAKLGYWYGEAPIIVESNNTGLAVIKLLEQMYHNIYHEAVYHARTGVQITKRPGFKTTGGRNGTRFLLLSRLQSFVRKKTGRIQCREMLKQMKQFVRIFKENGEKWTAGPGANDDAVFDMALNLENHEHMGKIVHNSFSHKSKSIRKRYQQARNNKLKKKYNWAV